MDALWGLAIGGWFLAIVANIRITFLKEDLKSGKRFE